MGRSVRYLGIESILLKYRDEILQPPLHLPTCIMEGRVKILETYAKSEEIISFYPHIFVHLQTIIANSKMVCCAVTLDTSFAQCLNREYRTVNKARC